MITRAVQRYGLYLISTLLVVMLVIRRLRIPLSCEYHHCYSLVNCMSLLARLCPEVSRLTLLVTTLYTLRPSRGELKFIYSVWTPDLARTIRFLATVLIANHS